MKHVLSVSYDEMLLTTRQLILEQAGYRVTSAEGFTAAMAASQRSGYDLLIIGHSITHGDKQMLAREFKRVCGAPILALLRLNETPLSEADFSVRADDGPVVLLQTVRRLLGDERRSEARA